MIDPNARMTPSRLEQLGVAAALLYCDSGVLLSRSVAQVVKDISLTTEHLRRTLEFANIKAYLTQYERQEPYGSNGDWTRYVSFSGGPALFEDVMDLLETDSSAKQEAFMPHSDDYVEEPEDYKAVKLASQFSEPPMQKEASLELEDEEPPTVRLESLYSDLSGALSKLDDRILKLSNLEPDAQAEFLKDAKMAVLQGYSLGDVRKVASELPDTDLDRMLNGLAHDHLKSIFFDEENINASFEKVSSAQPVAGHPIAQKFANWKEARCQLGSAQSAKKILKKKQAQVLALVREKHV